jgi:hypothetical protein
MLPFHELCFN